MRPPIDWMNWERIGEQLIDAFGYNKKQVMSYSEELENDKTALLKLYKSVVMGELRMLLSIDFDCTPNIAHTSS